MPGDDTRHTSSADIDELIRICNSICRQCRTGEIGDIRDEVATALLTTATMLYATATHEHGRQIEPFPDAKSIPATHVVVTTKAMLEAAGLSSFDLAMWSNRTPSRSPPNSG